MSLAIVSTSESLREQGELVSEVLEGYADEFERAHLVTTVIITLVRFLSSMSSLMTYPFQSRRQSQFQDETE